jgi:replicative DNA helicase
MIDTKQHEYAIIGSMLAFGGGAILDAMDSLNESHFSQLPARSIFQAYIKLQGDKLSMPSDVDIFAHLSATRQDLPQHDINEMIRCATPNHAWHIEALIDAYQRIQMRKTTLTYTQLLESQEHTSHELSEMIISDIMASVDHSTASYKHISEIAAIVANPKSNQKSIKTGFYDLDNLTSGLYPKEYIVIGARPSTGKTALMTNIAYNIAMQGIPVGIFSLEMPSEAIITRMVCGLANIPMFNKLEGKLTPYQEQRIQDVASQVSNLPIYINDDSSPTASSIRSTCRKWQRQNGVKVVFLDYITKISTSDGKKTDNREREISRISMSLKDTAKDLGITFVVMSQLSRLSEQRQDRRPVSSDLRDSGQIEQDADKIILLHKPGIGKTTLTGKDGSKYIELLVAKNRNGRIGACELYYDAEAMTFRNINNNPTYENEPIF